MEWFPLPGVIIVFLILLYLRQPNNGGKIGQKIRSSDHLAWQMEVEKRERELEELKKAEPKL